VWGVDREELGGTMSAKRVSKNAPPDGLPAYRILTGPDGRINRSREGHMAHIAQIKRPGLLTRTFFKIGERMFGQVPTPERLMAHRLPLMLGIGGLYGAIEWFGKIDAPLRALLNVQVAALYGVPY